MTRSARDVGYVEDSTRDIKPSPISVTDFTLKFGGTDMVSIFVFGLS